MLPVKKSISELAALGTQARSLSSLGYVDTND